MTEAMYWLVVIAGIVLIIAICYKINEKCSNENLEEDVEENDEDPREELVNRLIEYQAYKDITKLLQDKELLRKDIYTKVPENINNYIEELN